MRVVLPCLAVVLAVGGALGVPGSDVRAQGGGSIEAEVKYGGGPPAPKKLKVNKDTEKCGSEVVAEDLVVSPNKGVANVIVSVPGVAPSAPRKGVLDQQGCRFVPHVLVMTPGELEVRNSDDILHDFHTYSTANPSVNKPQPRFLKSMTQKLEKPEIVKVTCDVHPWMLGWVGVVPTAAAGVTDQNGTVRIDNVPPGKYTVEAWHETLGRQSREVDVRAGQVTPVSFEMKARP
jgi:carboxypeptidase family protein